MVIRFSAFYDALRHGQFPVRLLLRLNNGFGYPVVDFLYPLFLYLGVPIHLLGFGFVNTIKIILGLGLILSGLFSFFWLKKIFSNFPALVGGLIYALFPYHIYDIYNRGSVGEVTALAIVPFIFWQIEQKRSVFIALGIGLLITAHNVLALLFLPIVFLYMYIIKKYSKKTTLFVFIEGLALSAFFWIPAFYDRQYTVFDKTIVSDFSYYFISSISLIGIITVITLATSIFYLTKKIDSKLLFFFIISIISIFLASSFSNFVWQILPLGAFIQFPFRMISLSIISISFLTAYILQNINKKYLIIFSVISVVLIYISSLTFSIPKKIQYLPDTFYSTNEDSTTVQNEYMPKWVKQNPNTIQKDQISVINGEGAVNNIVKNAGGMTFDFQASSATAIQASIIYFPGWKVYINNKESLFSYDHPYGLINFNLPHGPSHVAIVFKETPLRVTADTISVIGILILGLSPLFKKKFAL